MLVTSITNNLNKIEITKAKANANAHTQNRQDSESTGPVAKLPALADAKSFVNISFKGINDLMSAAEHGNLERVIYELNTGLNINYRNQYGYSPLELACSYNNYDIVKELLSHKEIDVNTKDNYCRTPLIRISNEKNIDFRIIEALLEHPDIDVNARDKFGRTSLWYAASSDNIKLAEALLKHPKIDVNLAENDWDTPLHMACDAGNDVVKLLLQDSEINVNAKGFDGTTPLMRAVRKNHVKTAKLLLNHPNIDLTIRTSNGQSAYDMASYSCDHDKAFLKEMCEKGIEQLRNPELIGHANLAAVSAKLPPVDINKLSPEENIWSQKDITDTFIKTVAKEDYDSAMKMLENYPIIDLDADERKPLKKIMRTGNPDFVEKVFDYKFHRQKQLAEEYNSKREKFLNETIKALDYEALKENNMALNTLDGLKSIISKPEFNPNDSIDDKTLFERICVFDTEGEIVRTILSKYDDVNTDNAKASNNEIIKSLVEEYENGGKYKVRLENIKSKFSNPETREAAVESLNEFVSSDNFNPEMTDVAGNDVLHIISAVASDGSREIIQKILDKGGNIDSLNIGNQTPLMSAIKGLMIVKTEDEKSSILSNIKFLIDKGADVDAKDLNDQTVFHYVCRTLSAALLMLFLAKDPNVFIKDKYGNRAAKYLQSQEMKDIYQKYIMG